MTDTYKQTNMLRCLICDNAWHITSTNAYILVIIRRASGTMPGPLRDHLRSAVVRSRSEPRLWEWEIAMLVAALAAEADRADDTSAAACAAGAGRQPRRRRSTRQASWRGQALRQTGGQALTQTGGQALTQTGGQALRRGQALTQTGDEVPSVAETKDGGDSGDSGDSRDSRDSRDSGALTCSTAVVAVWRPPPGSRLWLVPGHLQQHF